MHDRQRSRKVLRGKGHQSTICVQSNISFAKDKIRGTGLVKPKQQLFSGRSTTRQTSPPVVPRKEGAFAEPGNGAAAPRHPRRLSGENWIRHSFGKTDEADQVLLQSEGGAEKTKKPLSSSWLAGVRIRAGSGGLQQSKGSGPSHNLGLPVSVAAPVLLLLLSELCFSVLATARASASASASASTSSSPDVTVGGYCTAFGKAWTL
ncbi:hypothetical protein BCV70DRAFT_207592 [Testicularia cyperi]|uniref:Uncharacterized protein n=1 Tax=Testicularia cyperi TaxID=1882483 RepID=A0A317XLZ5_9BASI|nr:hypothetical protein BCV70DRAFT_207592 [Testicularia cyperi]